MIKKIRIISILLNIVSYIIYLGGCFWLGVSLDIIGGLTFNDIGLYLIMFPTIVGFIFFNKTNSKFNIIVYFLTIIYFLLSLSYFTGYGVFDIVIYLIFIPVVLSFTLDKLNTTFNTIENWKKLLKTKKTDIN